MQHQRPRPRFPRLRQENLAWLTGTAAEYDPQTYRTRQFPTGHFDRPAVHRQEDETFVFAPASFRHFRPEPGDQLLLDGLWFITRAGPLWGISGETLAHHLAHRHRRRTGSRRAMRTCKGAAVVPAPAEPVETPDVLRYTETAGLATDFGGRAAVSERCRIEATLGPAQ